MAWVKSVSKVDGVGNIHPTQVSASIKVFATNNSVRVVQIDTHGSDVREMSGKLSQTLQFDENSARYLFDIFREAYGFK